MLIYPLSLRELARDRVESDDRLCEPSSNLYAEWKVKSGYYKNEQTMVDSMNAELKEAYSKIYTGTFEPFFRYDKETKFLRFSLAGELGVTEDWECGKGPAIKSISMSARAAGLGKALIKRLNLYSDKPFELDTQHLMYVYCDIVSPYLVGDVQTSLLRVVPMKGERDEMITATFDNPYYLPVARRGFDTIEININGEQGRPIPFSGGKSVAILHFRRRNGSVLSNASIG
jgi:hypothetical protein